MELGQKLREARTRMGIKQEELAQKIGVSRQTVSNWENGRSYPDIASVLKLSDLYGISLDELLKEDKAVQSHFEEKAAKRRRFWQLALECTLLLFVLGVLLAGRKFTTAGYALQYAGFIAAMISLWMHIHLFDHTKLEIGMFVTGFVIILGGMLVQLLFPAFYSETSLLLVFFQLVRSAGPLLVLFSGVWRQFWKSPRFFLILALLIGTPLLNIMDGLQDAGSLNQDTPFSQDYRIAQVLYPENQEADPSLRIDLLGYATNQRLRIYRNGDDYETIGTFAYQEPTSTQTEKGIWLLVPEENPNALYRVAVEADDSVTLSYAEKEQLQWKWLLRKEYLCSVSVATFGHTMVTNPEWLLPEEEDPVPYFKHTDVNGTASMTISIADLETETLTLQEEYHHGDTVEYAQYTLEPDKPGSFSLELKTRYDGQQEYALYRIPHKDGAFRFALTYDVGAKEALRQLGKK